MFSETVLYCKSFFVGQRCHLCCIPCQRVGNTIAKKVSYVNQPLAQSHSLCKGPEFLFLNMSFIGIKICRVLQRFQKYTVNLLYLSDQILLKYMFPENGFHPYTAPEWKIKLIFCYQILR
jgi:hypothetical protein